MQVDHALCAVSRSGCTAVPAIDAGVDTQSSRDYGTDRFLARDFSGSAFGMSMVLAADQFQILSGELRAFDRRAESGATLRCFFCPLCGTRIYHQKADAPGTIILKPGTLGDTDAVTPERQLWLSRKQGWIDLRGLPGFERQPG